MNLLVLLKQTFDTEESIVIKDGEVSEADAEFIINPYDEYSVEEAVQLKEKHGGTVTVLSIGPERVEEALRTALSMGVDKAILVDPMEINLDEYVIGEILKRASERQTYDIIFSGYMAIDDGAGQAGLRVAELLNLPHVSTVVNLTVNDCGKKLTVRRDVEGSSEIYEVETPVLLTTQQGLNEPRYPSIPNQMRAKMMPLERLSLEDIGFEKEEIKNKTSNLAIEPPPEKEEGKMIEGDVSAQVNELTAVLLNYLK